ncbi:MAG TPA: PEGA domain-containing protein [Lacunisphaera sp.]|nr:PEGA domain-containing protein [Lacunisphaera sp.]HQY06994.1 PEGA domain-containing protein [Lacunisphaera sp.]
MSTKLKLLVTLLALGVTHAFAQNSAPAKTTVQTKSSEKDGRTTTERTFTTTVTEVAEKPAGVTVAIFTANRAGEVGDNELGALEDYITGKVTELNVHVISGETALNAVAGMAPGAKANALDAQMADSTSAVRLAQALGATHLLQVTITGFDSNKQTIDAYGVKTINDERTARVTYKILDGNTGASLAADTVRATKVVQQSSGGLSDDRSGVLNDLLAEAAGKVATSLKRQIDRGRLTTSAAAGNVTVNFTTELADLYIPDVRIDKDNTVRMSEDKLKVSAVATIEVDGLAVGTAPGKLTVKPGLHKLRVVREGYKPWERTVNFTNGQTLNVGLEMSEAGYARWKESTAFINDLKNGAKLTDGQVKVLEGQAKMFENSGFKVNTKEGITINAGPTRSLFGW